VEKESWNLRGVARSSLEAEAMAENKAVNRKCEGVIIGRNQSAGDFLLIANPLTLFLSF